MNKAIISAPNTERAIIAALLADVDTFPTVKEQGLRADDLTDPFLAEVFRKYEQGFTSLPQLLDVMPDKLDELLTIQGEAGNLANVPYQAAALKEIAVRRELCRIAESVPKLAGNQAKAFLPVLNRLVSAFLEQKSRLETRRSISPTESLCRYTENLIAGNRGADVVPWGWQYLDKYFHVCRGEVAVIGAPPASGKTSFALATCLNVAKRGGRAALLCHEMPSSQLYDRCISMLSGVPLDEISADKPEVSAALSELTALIGGTENKPRLLIRGSGEYSHTVGGIANELRKFYNFAGGLDLFAVDYIQTVSVPNAKDRRMQIDVAAEEMKRLAIDLNSSCILLSQLNRESQNVPQRQGQPRYTLTSLKESAHLEEIATAVAFLENDPESNIIYFRIAKQRNGRAYSYRFKYNRTTQRFENIPSM